ncbi:MULTISPECIES: hypothetical protein [Chryseobacterium]|uniref:hypothetical protein n=1 Tax=Chryseobacterium TaxID=59732 RepID=UPI00191260BE|nr:MULTISPECIES: hypothetical protein [Chryseobacterium]MDQ8140506.1 hypothetical protein [Chryseobacterium sp. CFS15]QQQ29070.1 hypothetical protein JJL46_03405 [Chryseobacterium indoltheticum]
MESTGNIIYFCETKDYLQKITDILNKNVDSDFIIICSTSKKNNDISLNTYINNCISKAQEKSADILLGGVQNFHKILQIDENLFCIEKFHGFNFIILFNKIFYKIIKNKHLTNVNLEDFISEIAENIFVMHPFINLEQSSSDVDHYERSNIIIEDLKQIRKFYRS